jgi:opacity protein-like surface antigen
MTRRMICLLTCWLTLVSGGGTSGFLNRWSLRLSPGGILALGGSFTDVVKLNKALNMGLGLEAGLRYKVNDYVSIDVDYMFNWMSVKKDYQPFDYKELGPAFNLQMFTVDGTLFLSTGFVIKPYLTAGAGIYPWEFSQKPLWGDPWPAPADPTKTFSKTSFGVNAGLGLESHLFSRLSVFAELKYHYVYARDPGKFGTDDFTEQDFLAFHIGLNFSLGKK